MCSMPSRAAPGHLGQPLFVDRLAGRRGEKIVTAAVGVEARWQALGGEHPQAAHATSKRSFLLDQKCE